MVRLQTKIKHLTFFPFFKEPNTRNCELSNYMSKQVYLGIDLGAESGRVMAGLWDGSKMTLEEIHRFPNGGVYIGETLRWDIVRLWAEIQTGLTLAAKKHGNAVVSIGVDTWGVDFVL